MNEKKKLFELPEFQLAIKSDDPYRFRLDGNESNDIIISKNSINECYYGHVLLFEAFKDGWECIGWPVKIEVDEKLADVPVSKMSFEELRRSPQYKHWLLGYNSGFEHGQKYGYSEMKKIASRAIDSIDEEVAK